MAGPSVRERLLQALVTTLTPVAAGQGATVHRSPTVALSRDQCPALVLYPEAEALTERANDRVTRVLTVRVVALARPVDATPAETVADALLTAAHAALFADGNVGGLALGLTEQECEWEVDEADAVVVALPARYRLTYRTFSHDLATQG